MALSIKLTSDANPQMIYSRSTEFAIRAFVHLAKVPAGELVLAIHVAKEEGIPAHVLAKIFQHPALKGLLRSKSGPRGGFALRVDPNQIRLLEIVDALGPASYQRCGVGFSECTDDTLCPMHDQWVPLCSRFIDYLRQTSVGDLAKASRRC